MVSILRFSSHFTRIGLPRDGELANYTISPGRSLYESILTDCTQSSSIADENSPEYLSVKFRLDVRLWGK